MHSYTQAETLDVSPLSTLEAVLSPSPPHPLGSTPLEFHCWDSKV